MGNTVRKMCKLNQIKFIRHEYVNGHFESILFSNEKETQSYQLIDTTEAITKIKIHNTKRDYTIAISGDSSIAYLFWTFKF